MQTEVDKALAALTNKNPFVDANGNIRIGLRVPQIRSFVTKNFKYSKNESKSWMRYWDEVWKTSTYYESMSAALYCYQHRSLELYELKKVIYWIERCQSWEHSDDLSKIYAQVVEENPKAIVPTLKKWNRSSNPWKRRQSVVSLIEYASKRKTILPFKKLLSFINPLLDDQNYYVQKGLGWTMREIYNAYPREMIPFFEKNILLINPIAYSPATEKLNRKTKYKFNRLRKHRYKLQIKKA